MIKHLVKYRSLALFVASVTLIFCCQHAQLPEQIAKKDAKEVRPVHVDLDKIIRKGKITALTDNSSSSYFIYKGQPMGYEYELLELFAEHLGVELEIVIVDDLDEIFNELNSGRGDIIAANMTVTKERSELVSFAEHHLLTRQVLVQRYPDHWSNIPPGMLESTIIRNPIDLIDREVHVRKNSSFYSRLQSLSDEIGGEINVVQVPGDYETEQLIHMVANGQIMYTIADENVAMINRTYYSNIDIKTPISFPQKIAWAVRKNSPDLLSTMNMWIKSMQNNVDYIAIYDKYYRSPKAQRDRAKSEFSSIAGGQISKYDNLIQAHSEVLDWDWRLLASQICQESRFDPKAESWSGAQGLMQLLPETAERFGVVDISSPDENMRAGTLYLSWLDGFWSNRIINETERVKFVLASYNVGLGHVIDARNLAVKYKSDPNTWEGNVDHYLLMKSRAKFYNDTTVRHGYCRGEEPYNYVKEILTRYEHYKNVIS